MSKAKIGELKNSGLLFEMLNAAHVKTEQL